MPCLNKLYILDSRSLTVKTSSLSIWRRPANFDCKRLSITECLMAMNLWSLPHISVWDVLLLCYLSILSKWVVGLHTSLYWWLQPILSILIIEVLLSVCSQRCSLLQLIFAPFIFLLTLTLNSLYYTVSFTLDSPLWRLSQTLLPNILQAISIVSLLNDKLTIYLFISSAWRMVKQINLNSPIMGPNDCYTAGLFNFSRSKKLDSELVWLRLVLIQIQFQSNPQ